ncbi:putative SSD domain-containing protein [Gammaproteobacteria bacterium]
MVNNSSGGLGSGFPRLIVHHPKVVVAIVFLLVMFLAAGLTRLKYIGDLDSTLPDNSALTSEIRRIQGLFGTNDTVAFVIDGANFETRLKSSCALIQYLKKDSDVVSRTISGLGSSSTNLLTNRDGSLAIESSDSLCRGTPMSKAAILDGLGPQRDSLIGSGEGLVVYADLNIINGAYLPFYERALRYGHDASAPEIKILMTGQPSFMSAMQIYSQRIGLLLPIVIIVIGALHFEALRSRQAVIIPILTGIMATLMAVGCMGWLGMPMDEYSSTAPILILAVAAGHSVQLLKRYMEELSARTSSGVVTREANEDALLVTLERMAPVLTAAVVAASLCLFSLMLFDIKAISRFGAIAGTGLIFALVIELSLIPSIRIIFPPKKIDQNFGKLAPHWTNLLRSTSELTLSVTPLITGIVIVILLTFGVIGAFRLKLSASITEPFSPDIAERVAIESLNKQAIGTFPLDIVLDSGAADHFPFA